MRTAITELAGGRELFAGSPTLIKAVAGLMLIDCSLGICCDEPPQPPVIMIASVAVAKDPIRLLKVRR